MTSNRILNMLNHPSQRGFEWFQHCYNVQRAWKRYCSNNKPQSVHCVAYNILLGRPTEFGFGVTTNAKKTKSGQKRYQSIHQDLWSLITGGVEQWKPFQGFDVGVFDPEGVKAWQEYLGQQYQIIKDKQKENNMSELRKGVCVLFVNNDKCLTVTRADGSGVCLPGGKLEHGETFLDAACREIWEETSLRITQDQLISIYRGVCDDSNKNDAPFDVECFWAFDSSGTPLQREEGITPKWSSVEELLLNSPFSEYNMQALNKFKDKFPSVGGKLMPTSESSYEKPNRSLSI